MSQPKSEVMKIAPAPVRPTLAPDFPDQEHRPGKEKRRAPPGAEDAERRPARLKRKEYEKELRQAPGEAVPAPGMGQAQGVAGHHRLRRTGRRGQGRHDQGDHRAREPANFPGGGAAGAVGPGEVADVHPAVHAALPRRGGGRDLRSSWYNRAGIEYVMGFCTKKQHKRFLELCPIVERYIVDDGVMLIKVWLEVSDKEQKRRFEARIDDRSGNGSSARWTCPRGASGSSIRGRET